MTWVMPVTMYIITLFILAGIYRSFKVRNYFAVGFGAVSFLVFAVVDYAIIQTTFFP